MASPALLLHLLLLVASANAYSYYGGSMTFFPKGQIDGKYEADFHLKQTVFQSFIENPVCVLGQCGTQIRRSHRISASTSDNISWTQHAVTSTRQFDTNRPFEMRLPNWVNWEHGAGYWVDNIFGQRMQWRSLIHVDLGTRSDTGESNRAPIFTTPPVLRVTRNCPRTFRIAAFDPDGDDVRCRVPTDSATSECGICKLFNGFSFDQSSCSLTYNYSSYTGIHPIELLIEDFPTKSINLSYSDRSYTTKHPLSLTRHKRLAVNNVITTSTAVPTTSTSAAPTTTRAIPTTTSVAPTTTTTRATPTTTSAAPTTRAVSTTTSVAPTTTTTRATPTTTSATPTTTTRATLTTTSAIPTTTTRAASSTTTSAAPTTTTRAASTTTTTSAAPTTTTRAVSTTTSVAPTTTTTRAVSTTTSVAPTTTTIRATPTTTTTSAIPTTTTRAASTTTTTTTGAASTTTTRAVSTTTRATPTTTTSATPTTTTTRATPTTTTTSATTTTTNRAASTTTTTSAAPTTRAVSTTTSVAPTTTTTRATPTTTSATPTTTTRTAPTTTTSATPTTTTSAAPTTTTRAASTTTTTSAAPTTTTRALPTTTTTRAAPTITTSTTKHPLSLRRRKRLAVNYPATTVVPTTTMNTNGLYRASIPPLSKLPLDFSVHVDSHHAPSCLDGDYFPVFLAPTPANRAYLPAFINQPLEIKVRSMAQYTTIHDLLVVGPAGILKEKVSSDTYVLKWTPSPNQLYDYFPICFISDARDQHNQVYQSELRCVTVSTEHHGPA